LESGAFEHMERRRELKARAGGRPGHLSIGIPPEGAQAMRIRGSLKSRLIFYSLSITFFVLVSLAGISFLTVRNFLRAGSIETTRYKLRIAMASIDRDMDRLIQLVNWCSVSPEVASFVSSSGLYPDDRKFKALSAYRSVRDAVNGNGLDSYIDKLVIGGFEGHSIQVGLSQGHRNDFAVALAQFKLSGESIGIPFCRGGPFEEGFAFSSGRLAFPVAKAVRSDDDSNRPIGFVFMAVNQAPIARFLADYDLEAGSSLCIAIGESVYGIGPGRELVPGGAGPTGAALASAARAGSTSIEAESCGRRETFILSEGLRSGWVLAQSLPAIGMARQARGLVPLLAVVALFFVLLVALVLATVNRTVNRPIELINRRVALVSRGDFSRDPGIEWDNELGNIGRAVNTMSRDIEELIERRVEDEKAKKALEFRALQSQINPHFLYNTLGAIRWMAEIQKAPGIAEMVNSLAALLRHAARGADALVTLETELELVGEYCTIQRYRSANLFELELSFAEPILRRCKVVKFTLQPIVENAIMHGIEPKMAPGRIRIEVARPRTDLVRVDVVDDGVGIEAERLGALLLDGDRDGEAFNRIGLYNVDERLKLAFGPDFGLSVESRKGEYTKVSVLLPYLVDGEEKVEELDREGACTRC
jgi:two-component system, sensor histidine kinase YesM